MAYPHIANHNEADAVEKTAPAPTNEARPGRASRERARGSRASLAPASPGEERTMDEQTRQRRTLDALEIIAAELEKLRILLEHKMGFRVVDEEGSLYVRPAEA
jgi:uncharacterized FlaG/YvyC family protein